MDAPSWVPAPFLTSPLPAGPIESQYGPIAPDFEPWNTVQGRDGEFYGFVNEGRARGGLIYSLHPKGFNDYGPQGYGPRAYAAGRARRVYALPAPPATAPANRLPGSIATGSIAIGQDGAIYSRSRDGGAFAAGVLFKLDRLGKYLAIHHFEKPGAAGELIAARNGDLFAAITAPDPGGIGSVLRLSKDGACEYIGVAAGEMKALVETANQEILLATIPGGDVPASENGVVWRLNSSGDFEPFAVVGHSPQKFLALPNGDVLCMTTQSIVQITPAGVVTVIHQFTTPQEGLQPESIFFYQPNGFYLGTTSAGGTSTGGTSFEINSYTNAYRVRSGLPHPTSISFRRISWMNQSFPLRVAADGNNLPPAARDDSLNTASLRRVAGSPAASAVIRVLANDTDANKNPLTVAAVGAAAHGTVTIDPASKLVTYTTTSAPLKNDRFTYTISDGQGGTATGQVFIRTNPAARYSGVVNSETANVGTLSVAMGADRVAAGRLEFEGRIYRFTGRLNDFNQTAAVLSARPGETLALQLFLRPDGAKYKIQAAIQKNGIPHTAICTPPDGAVK